MRRSYSRASSSAWVHEGVSQDLSHFAHMALDHTGVQLMMIKGALHYELQAMTTQESRVIVVNI